MLNYHSFLRTFCTADFSGGKMMATLHKVLRTVDRCCWHPFLLGVIARVVSLKTAAKKGIESQCFNYKSR